MPKYMLEVNYTLDGVRGLLGGTDAFAIVDVPDNASAAAFALNVAAGGGATVNTVALLTPDEIDGATSKKVKYTPPGA